MDVKWTGEASDRIMDEPEVTFSLAAHRVLCACQLVTILGCGRGGTHGTTDASGDVTDEQVADAPVDPDSGDPDAGDPGTEADVLEDTAPECMDAGGPASHWVIGLDSPDQERVADLLVMADGSILLAGAHGPYGAENLSWLVRVDGTGTVLGQTIIEGVVRQFGPSVAPLDDCGFVVAAATRGSGAGGLDLWIARFDPAGLLVWQRTVGTEADDHKPNVLQTRDGGYFVSALTAGGAGEDLWLLRLEDDGSVGWQFRIGGDRDEVQTGRNTLAEDAHGNLYVLAQSHSFTDSLSDAWLLALDASGSILWQKAVGAVGGLHVNTPLALLLDSSGLVFVGQTELSAFPGTAAWVVRMTPSGLLVWQKACGSFGSDSAMGIAHRPGGGYFLLGQVHLSGPVGVHYDLWLASMDAEGDLGWQLYLGDPASRELAAGLAPHRDGLVVAGQTEELDPTASDPRGVIVARVGADGSFSGSCPLVTASTSFCADSLAGVVDTDAEPVATDGLVMDASATLVSASVPDALRCPE